MTSTVIETAQSLTAIIIMFGLFCALMEWLWASPEQVERGRLEARVWCIAGLGLAVGLVLARGELTGHGAIWLIQGLLVAVLVRVGGMWAMRCGVNPFGLLRRRWRRWPWRWLLTALGAIWVWTALLMNWFKPRASEAMVEGLGLDQMHPYLVWPFLVGIISLAPILEECFFRHYLLYRLAWQLRRGPAPMAISIALTSLLWAVAHVGFMQPVWLKLVQTGAIGIVLGMTARRHGLEAAIALHWAFNLFMIPLGMWVSG